MHDIKLIIENLDEVKKKLEARSFDVASLDQVINKNEERKKLIAYVEGRRSDIKKLSAEVGKKKKAGENADVEMKQVAEIKKEMQQKDEELNQIAAEINNELATIPNLISNDIPLGKDENDNKEISKWGEIPSFNFKPKDHTELGEALDMLDFETGAKLAGARFVVYKDDIARMERALINFMLDFHAKNGYREVIPPFIVNQDAMYGTGQLPKFAEDSFKIEGRDWFLIPTAEVPITNMLSKSLFGGEVLPAKFVAYTPCFRSEAGSYGKDTKGLIRLHQFNKVEMVNIVKPEDSEKYHQEMIASACGILEALKLPYRAMLLCSGDIGFSAQKCVDLEVWLPGQDKYREISSISNCGSFQARRAGIRFRNDRKKPEFAHTLNGSGLALGRTVVAIMENYQREDGSIEIPEVLRPYMGGQELISKK